MAKDGFTCEKCGRKFSMAAHLARHMSSHGAKSTKKKKTKAMKPGKRRGRPPGSKNKKSMMRTAAASSTSFDLRGMHLEELTELMNAAREEAHRKLREAQAALR